MADEYRWDTPEMYQRKCRLNVVMTVDNIRSEWNIFQTIHHMRSGSRDLVGDSSEKRRENANVVPGLG